MRPSQKPSDYLFQAESLRKIAAELERTDTAVAASLLEMAVEYVMKANTLLTAH